MNTLDTIKFYTVSALTILGVVALIGLFVWAGFSDVVKFAISL